MDILQAANALNGSEYGQEGDNDLFSRMKDAGIVAAFGASDDLMEFRGAVYDEIDAYGGGSAFFNKHGIVKNECSDQDCPHFEYILAGASEVTAEWNRDGYSWVFDTRIPHMTFEVVEDGERYCRGLVFNIKDA